MTQAYIYIYTSLYLLYVLWLIECVHSWYIVLEMAKNLSFSQEVFTKRTFNGFKFLITMYMCTLSLYPLVYFYHSFFLCIFLLYHSLMFEQIVYMRVGSIDSVWNLRISSNY